MSLPPSPVTPLFRLLVRPAPRSPDDGSLPAEVPGQCGAESAVLAAAALLAVFAGGLDVTAWIPAAWLRIPAAAVATVALLHAAILTNGLLLRRGRSLRQAWAFMAVLTVWAAIRAAAGGPIAWLCLPWLAVAALNLPAAVLLRRRPPIADRPPYPPPS